MAILKETEAVGNMVTLSSLVIFHFLKSWDKCSVAGSHARQLMHTASMCRIAGILSTVSSKGARNQRYWSHPGPKCEVSLSRKRLHETHLQSTRSNARPIRTF